MQESKFSKDTQSYLSHWKVKMGPKENLSNSPTPVHKAVESLPVEGMSFGFFSFKQ